MIVLGVETSCDETAVAVYDRDRGLLAHLIHSQVAIHAPFGGVVPELASRDHIRKLLPMVERALAAAGVPGSAVDGVAYTAGPGLIGALLVGATVATGLAAAWQVPAIAVHHMEAHLLAPLLEDDPPAFPFVALLVSGGHTMLVEVAGLGRYRLLGQTLDDAAGEAFDKTAKMLGLPYPGGPQLARPCRARAGRTGSTFRGRCSTGPGSISASAASRQRSCSRRRSLRAGTALRESDRVDLANSFQEAVVDTLVAKCARAMDCNRSRAARGGGRRRRQPPAARAIAR